MSPEQREKLIYAAARALPPSDHVPYAFEKRIMAALSGETPVDPWAVWSRLLWRAAAPCVAIMVAMSLWTVATSAGESTSVPLATDLEQTVLAPLASLSETW